MATNDILVADRAYLLADSDIAAEVGTRIYPDALPPGYDVTDGPAIVLIDISGGAEHHLDGALGQAEARIEHDCYAATAITAQKVRELVRQRLAGYRGAMGDEFVQFAEEDGRTGRYEPPESGAWSGRYIRTVDIRFYYEQALGE